MKIIQAECRRSGIKIEAGHGERTKCGKAAWCEDCAEIHEDGREVRKNNIQYL
jgi:hypothetical protein